MKRANLSPAWKSVVFIVLFSSRSLLKTSSHISPVSIPWLQTLFGIPLTITFTSEIKCLLTVSSTSDMRLVKKNKSLHWPPWNIAAHIDGRAWSLIYWDYLEMSDALGCKPHRARPRRGRSRSGKIWLERVHGKTEAKPEVLRKMKDNRQTKIRMIPLCQMAREMKMDQSSFNKMLRQLMNHKYSMFPCTHLTKEFRIFIKEEATGYSEEWCILTSILLKSDCCTAALTSNSQIIFKGRKQ